MSPLPGLVFVALCLQLAEFSDPRDCVIELECLECIPDNMPLVTSHSARDGAVRVPHGAEVALSCGGGAFLAYPLRRALVAACDAGRYRVTHDNALRHLLELGCQENVFEDVLHPVEHCAPPLQGRAYQMQEPGSGAVRHLAAVCFDPDRAIAVHLQVAPALPPHSEARAPLSLFGNFNEMFDAATRRDAERLYADDARLTRRLRELVRPAGVSLAGQQLTAGRLLAPAYFDEKEARVADFPSNKVAVWRSVAEGNLRRVQADVAALARAARGAVRVWAGTHGAAAADGAPLRLRGGRFPVPRYVWTAVWAPARRRGLALAVLNDPFVAVSEVRGAVFCESACAAVGWLAESRRHRSYERPIHGLLFCCNLEEFAALVPEMPRFFNGTVHNLNTADFGEVEP